MAKFAPRSIQSSPPGVPTRNRRKATGKPARAAMSGVDLWEMSQSSFEAVGLRRGAIFLGSCVNGVNVGALRAGSSSRIVPPRFDSSKRAHLNGHEIVRRTSLADVVPPFHGSE